MPLGYSLLWLITGVALTVVFLTTGGNPVCDLLLSQSTLCDKGEAETILVHQVKAPAIKQPQRVAYTFTAGPKQIKGRCYTSDSGLVSQIKSGNPIEVRYLKSSPKVSRIVGAKYSNAPIWGIVTSLVMLVLGGIIMTRAIMKYIRIRTLLLYGQKTTGVLNAVKYQRTVNHRKPNLIDASYIFKDFRGEPVRGRSRTFIEAQAGELNEGDQVDVVYLREDPDKNYSLVNGIRL
jgi:hypothetical protein